MTATLTKDIYANRDKVLYGKKGDVVTIISYSDPVYIVEGSNGNRFPVHEDFLTIKTQHK